MKCNYFEKALSFSFCCSSYIRMNKILCPIKGLNRKAVDVNKNFTAKFTGIHCIQIVSLKYRKLSAETYAFQVDVPK